MNWENFRLQKRLFFKEERTAEIYSIISDIDSIKKSWQITNRLLPITIDRLTNSVIVTSSGSSNRIEGNVLSDTEVENLYKNLHIRKFKSRDEEEIAGYLESIEYIFNDYNEIKLTESFILQLHNSVLRYSKRDLGHKGNYKKSSNRVEAKDSSGNVVGVIFDPTPPYLVKKEMEELLGWYNWSSTNNIKHPLILIANFIFEYLAIHPFYDGNGRTARLLTNLLFLKNDYQFAKIVSHEQLIESSKEKYYLSLNKTQQTWKTDKEDISHWLLYFLETVREQSQKSLTLLEGDNLEYLLSSKQLALWQWVEQNNVEFSRFDAIKALGFPARTTESIIKKLLDLNCVERLGQGRATRYRIKKR